MITPIAIAALNAAPIVMKERIDNSPMPVMPCTLQARVKVLISPNYFESISSKDSHNIVRMDRDGSHGMTAERKNSNSRHCGSENDCAVWHLQLVRQVFGGKRLSPWLQLLCNAVAQPDRNE